MSLKPLPKFLSKTKIMRGYQCLKNIYLTVHHPELESPITAEQRARFDQGHEVGAQARTRFPDGVLVENPPWDFIGSLRKTKELLNARTKVIFEAAFEHKSLYARADVIVFSEETGRWSIYEVKSSLKVKPEQIEDIRLQAWIMVNSGLPIERICILHLNPECEFPHLSNLFIEVDVTEKVRENYTSIVPKLKEIFSALKEPKPPASDIGPHCDRPYECQFKTHCWEEKGIPELSIFQMPQMYDRQWELYQEGVISMMDPRLKDLTPLQQRVVEVHRTKRRFIDREKMQETLKTWSWPFVFLDFETINPALPRFVKTRPFSQTPFQFSVHLWRQSDSSLEHFEFLHAEATDPREALIPALLAACGTQGSIIAYFAKFESERIQELAEFSLPHREALLALIPRLVDPLPVLRDCVYDVGFKGSFSLKSVAPALLGDAFSYSGLLITDGGACQRAFEEMIRTGTSERRRQELRTAILEYCKRDTLVMVELTKWMMAV